MKDRLCYSKSRLLVLEDVKSEDGDVSVSFVVLTFL